MLSKENEKLLEEVEIELQTILLEEVKSTSDLGYLCRKVEKDTGDTVVRMQEDENYLGAFIAAVAGSMFYSELLVNVLEEKPYFQAGSVAIKEYIDTLRHFGDED